MEELSNNEIEMVNGGLDPETGGLAIIGLGFASGPATAVFGVAIGGSLLLVSTLSKLR